jgi:hypothetical protein
LPGRPRPDQAITPAGRRLEHSSIAAERLADRRYVGVEGIFPDNHASPDAPHEFILADEVAGRLNQNFDDVECTLADGDPHSSRAQLTAGEIDLPFACLIQQSILSSHFARLLKDFSDFFRNWQRPQHWSG